MAIKNMRKYYNIDGQNEEEKPEKKRIFANVDKWSLFKKIVGTVASGCATIVISKYMKASMPETDSMVDKAVMGVGMYFITGIVGSKVAKYAEQELDEWKDSIMQMKDPDILEESIVEEL